MSSYTWVIFNPSFRGTCRDGYYTGDKYEDGRTKATSKVRKAMQFKTAREAYEFAATLPRLQDWRVGKRECAGAQ